MQSRKLPLINNSHYKTKICLRFRAPSDKGEYPCYLFTDTGNYRLRKSDMLSRFSNTNISANEWQKYRKMYHFLSGYKSKVVLRKKNKKTVSLLCLFLQENEQLYVVLIFRLFFSSMWKINSLCNQITETVALNSLSYSSYLSTTKNLGFVNKFSKKY